MQAHIRLGRLFGVDIGLHYSGFIIALMIIFSLGGYHLTRPYHVLPAHAGGTGHVRADCG